MKSGIVFSEKHSYHQDQGAFKVKKEMIRIPPMMSVSITLTTITALCALGRLGRDDE